jgi:putative hydrolase of the HAD superfamily
MGDRVLLIDADDTLWQNNIYFEQVRAQFLDWMRLLGADPEDVIDVFNTIEQKNIRINGYGCENFVQSLKETYLRFKKPGQASKAGMNVVDAMACQVRNHPIELLEGVQESLEALSLRCKTILFTKGSEVEQNRKLEASGLARYFSAIEIVREKDVGSYQELITRRRLPRADTWMVGNSPKSDINPAVAAGLRAFYIPHRRTWDMELEDLHMPDQVVVLQRFSDLLNHL